MKKFLVVACCAVALVGCMSTDNQTKGKTAQEIMAEYNQKKDFEKQQLIASLPPAPSETQIKNTKISDLPKDLKEIIGRGYKYSLAPLKDPDSAIYDFYATPKKGYVQILDYANGEPIFGWLVPYSLNAKNSYGGYTGAKYYNAFIVENDPEKVIFSHSAILLEDKKYIFVELK